jgi:hypothetical protein
MLPRIDRIVTIQILILAFLPAALRYADGAELFALPEHLRPGPFGEVVAVDRPSGTSGPLLHDSRRPFVLAGGRDGYVSLQLVVKAPARHEYSLSVEPVEKGSALEIEVFREWFHATGRDRSHYPDALVPVTMPFRHAIPDPDNRIPEQTAQGYWIDIWIPSGATPGVHRLRAALDSGGNREVLRIDLMVLEAVIPKEDPIVVDHNSYGSSWLGQYYGIGVPSDDSLRMTHLYHRLFYEHRGIFHQLGYGHGGKVIREFAPELAGSGRTRRVASWELYDRHYGPLLDGTAFSGSRRGARPVPFVYLPINPEWPASFLSWGEPGYETEFVNVVAEMERHFRDKGWTGTRFEMFFNHKKRYKAFPWDGDETRFPEDDRYFLEYARLLKKAVPPDSPVRIVFRNDTSWSMERQFRALAGAVNFWVCGNSLLSWYPDAVRTLRSRGDIVWMYGGAPAVTEISVRITESMLRTWLYGAQGWVHWQTVDPGSDAWYRFDGGAEVLAYPGTRFGIQAPIPSLRLKLQRNCVQDLALLDALSAKYPARELRDETARRYDGSSAVDWWTPRPKLADLPPYEWSNTSIGEATNEVRPYERRIDSASWQRVREYIHRLAGEAK